MSDPFLKRRPRLAYPFTILTAADTVRLVAGEDQRYTLRGANLDAWLPMLLQRFLGKETVADLIATLPSDLQQAALQIIANLYGERVLVDGSANDAHTARKYRVVLEGQGGLVPLLQRSLEIVDSTAESELVILCQDQLDFAAALHVNRRCRLSRTPWLWASYAAMSRAYVSPLFLPDAGPCFGCLLRSFERLSPAPELYDALREHARQQKPIAAAEFPEEGLAVLHGLILWKRKEAERAEPGPALYRLHVLEREHFEVSTHRVFVDPYCPECGEGRP